MGINGNQILFESKETSKLMQLFFMDKTMAERLMELVLEPLQLHLINNVVEDYTEDSKTTPITKAKDDGACGGKMDVGGGGEGSK